MAYLFTVEASIEYSVVWQMDFEINFLEGFQLPASYAKLDVRNPLVYVRNWTSELMYQKKSE